ncbi:hypothetical protein [Nocardioides ungokensis]
MTEARRPEPAPGFAEHFTDPLYEDRGNELAPFGSDEGSDLLASWRDRSGELGPASTLATVLDCEPSQVAAYAGEMSGVDGIETAMFIASAAFVLLRLTGHLSDGDRRLALEALDFQIRILPEINSAVTEAPEVLLRQRDDLASWRNPV